VKTSPRLTRFFDVRRILALALVGCIALLYGNVVTFEFLNFDDNVYVSQNVAVKSGLSGKTLSWAFQTLEAGFWQPLTWLSYLIDFEIYGSNAGGYHLTNVILHIGNALLLFHFLYLSTGYLWRAFLVALLFAIHPLHVESVVSLAARKDVLSTFFLMLTLIAYHHHVRKPAILPYLSALTLFACGMMAKSMLITLPFVLLLLDHWPFGRFSAAAAQERDSRLSCRFPDTCHRLGTTTALILEKIPFLMISVAFFLLTYRAEDQVGSVSSLAMFPLDVRLANALVAYATYLYKTVYPFQLSMFYPHPIYWPMPSVDLSAFILMLVSIAAWISHRRIPYISVGWLWYLGTLVPVIGLIQIGNHAYADRYTYVPLIGIFILLVWGTAQLSETVSAGRRRSLALLAAAMLLLLGVTAFNYAQQWRDTITLFTHALKHTRNNVLALVVLSSEEQMRGNAKSASEHYRKAVVTDRAYVIAIHRRGGLFFLQQNDFERAFINFYSVLKLDRTNADAFNHLGVLMAKIGRCRDAQIYFKEAYRLKPDDQAIKSNYLQNPTRCQGQGKGDASVPRTPSDILPPS